MDVTTGSFTRTDRFGDNRDSTFPEFMLVAVHDELASQRAGYPIFRDEEQVKIHIPGNSLSIPVERVNDVHRERWPEQYKRFKAGQEMAHEGTPLEMWPPIASKAQVLFLKHHEVHTVEGLAQVSDFNLNKLGMGARQLRDLARSFLSSAERNAMTNSLMKENERLGMDLLDAQKQINELKGICTSLQTQIEGLANRPNVVAHHVPGAHDPFSNFSPPQPAHLGTPAPAPSFDPLASFAQMENRRAPHLDELDKDSAA